MPSIARRTNRSNLHKEYSDSIRQEQHSVLVDYNVFVKASAPNKDDPQHLYIPADFDLRLQAGSAAIDAGELLPTINDDFTGRAPDLGAYEFNRPLPHYGPR
jgi:hypothetical protein